MVSSVLTLHSGAWSNLGHAEYDAWAGAIFRIYSGLLPKSQHGAYEHSTFYALADQMQSPMPVEWLHLQKLRLAAQIATEGDHLVFESLLHNLEVAGEDSWIAGLERSFAWMHDMVDDAKILSLSQGLRMLDGWDAMKSQQRAIRTAIKQAEKAHLLRIRVMKELQEQKHETKNNKPIKKKKQ